MNAARVVGVGMCTLLLSSCPALIKIEQIIHAKDKQGPMITITSPADKSPYGSTVEVSGTVTDSAANPDDEQGVVQSLAYAVVDTALGEDVELGAEGDFTFSFFSKGLIGDLAVELEATDWNGNTVQTTLTLRDDGVGPYLVITSPDDGGYYAKTVVLAGTISNAEAEPGQTGEVSSLSYEVLGTAAKGELSFDASGAFSLELPTVGFEGPKTIRVTAEDWNAHASEANVTVLDAGNDIPSFAAEPGNHAVTLDWDPVPLATSYTLYYTRNGSLPSPDYGSSSMEDVSSPLTLAELENGAMHVFLLQAHSSGGEDNWSGFVRAIPLSEQTLAPQVYSESRQLRVTWPSIPATDEFEVWRCDTRDGEYISVSGTWSGTEFADEQATGESGYYYKIRPALAGSRFSTANHGVPAPFWPGGIIRTVSTGNAYGSAAASGGFVYFPAPSGLEIIDVDPPELASVVKIVDAGCRAVAVSGGYAYGAYGWLGASGLVIIDIAPLGGAAAVKTVETYNAFAVAVSGGYAYVADSTDGLRIIDIDPVGDAHVEATFDTTDARGVAVSGGYAFVADGNAGLLIVDVDPPDHPQLATAAVPMGGWAGWVAVSGDYAYVATTVGLKIVDIDPIDGASVAGTVPIAAPQAVAVSAGFALVADRYSGLRVVDIDPVASASVVRTVDTPGDAYGVAASGRTAYVTDYFAGGAAVQVIDASVAEPTLVKSVGAAKGRDLAVSGGYVYVTDWEGLRIVDVSVPEEAVVVKTVAGESFAEGVAVSGGYAYVADGTSGLQIIDVDPVASAARVATIAGVSNAVGVAVSGEYAYVAGELTGLQIIDISRPSSPIVVGTLLPSSGLAQDVAVCGTYAYVAAGNALDILDVTDPRSAVLVRSVPCDAFSVSVSGGYAFVASGFEMNQLHIIDVSPAESASLVASPECGSSNVLDAAVSGIYALVASESWALDVLDISTPDSAFFVCSLPIAGPALAVGAAGRYVYVACEDAGLQIIDLLAHD